MYFYIFSNKASVLNEFSVVYGGKMKGQKFIKTNLSAKVKLIYSCTFSQKFREISQNLCEIALQEYKSISRKFLLCVISKENTAEIFPS